MEVRDDLVDSVGLASDRDLEVPISRWVFMLGEMGLGKDTSSSCTSPSESYHVDVFSKSTSSW